MPGAEWLPPACKTPQCPSPTATLSSACRGSEFLLTNRVSQSLGVRIPTLRRRFIRMLMLCAAMYLLACLGCVSFQRRLIYFPTVCTAEKADELAKSERLERWRSPSGKSLGWKSLSLTQPSQGKVLIMHGNASCAYESSHYA